MKKELFFAIAAGLILGLIIAFGIWRINKTITPNNKTQASQNPSPTPQESPCITLSNVSDFDVLTENKILLKGITQKDSTLGISSQEKDYLVFSDVNGVFEKEIELTAGINKIILKTFGDDKTCGEETLTVIFSSEFSKYQTQKEETQEQVSASDSNSVRQKVEEKVQNAANKAVAFVGTVTDISENALQIKNDAGEIQQISTSEETSFVKIDKTQKTIKFEDLAIGDFIVAMGFKNGSEVLSSKRILVEEAPEETSRKIFSGNIKEIIKKDIVFSIMPDSEDKTVLTDSDTDILSIQDSKLSSVKLTALEENQQIYVFTYDEEQKTIARTIYFTETPQEDR